MPLYPDFVRDVEQLRNVMSSTQGLLNKFSESMNRRAAAATTQDPQIGRGVVAISQVLVEIQGDFAKVKANIDLFLGLFEGFTRNQKY